jgi:hypothetical protein
MEYLNMRWKGGEERARPVICGREGGGAEGSTAELVYVTKLSTLQENKKVIGPASYKKGKVQGERALFRMTPSFLPTPQPTPPR